MSHITITTHDYDSESGRELNAQTTVDTVQDESDFHARMGREGLEQWPPCCCPIHVDPDTGRGTRLNVSGLHLVRHAEPC